MIDDTKKLQLNNVKIKLVRDEMYEIFSEVTSCEKSPEWQEINLERIKAISEYEDQLIKINQSILEKQK